MHNLSEKPKTARQTALTNSSLSGRARFEQAREVDSILRLQRTIGNQAVQRLLSAGKGSTTGEFAGFDHDLGRVPVFVRQRREDRQALQASGEMAEGSLNEGEEWLPATGEGMTAAKRVSGGDSADVAREPGGAAPQPNLRKTTVDPLRTQNNGGFSWGVRWSIQNASGSTNGWIVQHVLVRQNVTNTAGSPVVPGQGSYGGLRTSWYPLWEAWQVRAGNIFVGGSASAHNADTYAQGAVGAGTKGKTEVAGRADFYPNLTLPASFTVRNTAPAWALPATNTDPGLAGGTGALDHNLTATWDSVSGTGATTATTV